jgi:hypothetical protein
MSPEERLLRLANFRGYGDYDKSRFLYIGIEEGLALTEGKIDEHLDGSSIDIPWSKPALGYPTNITERMQALLSIALLKNFDKPCEPDVSKYLLSEKNEFCANIYPIGAKSLKYQPPQYEHLFEKNKPDAQFNLVKERKVIIKEMIHDFLISEDGKVFIFGKNAHDFLDRYNILDELKIQISDDRIEFKGKRPSTIRYSTDLKVWLTGHPSYSWFNGEAIDEIIKKINE